MDSGWVQHALRHSLEGNHYAELTSCSILQFSRTPLIWASATGQGLNIVRALLDAGADMEVKDLVGGKVPG